MSTTIKPQLSKKNQYWIEKHRYYELKHFCLQYPIWKQARAALDGLSHRPWDAVGINGYSLETVVERTTAQSMYYAERMSLVERCCYEAYPELARYLLVGITEGKTYEQIQSKDPMPFCRETYYEAYRKFFYILNKCHY